MTVQEIRNCGVTRQKTEYIKLLSKNFLKKNFKVSELEILNDEDALLINDYIKNDLKCLQNVVIEK